MDKKKNYQLLKKAALKETADLFGVADISGIREEFTLSQNVVKHLDKAIVLGARLSSCVLEEITDQPTKIYYYHYRTVNTLLDQIALKLTNLIQSKGFRALPIPATQVINWEEQKAHLSHKKIGIMAGLGWIGRNNLLVNKELGSQFRVVTILTDMPLETDQPAKDNCGACRLCMVSCPAGAIKEVAADFEHRQCFEKLKEFHNKRMVDQYVCGICVKSCKGKVIKDGS